MNPIVRKRATKAARWLLLAAYLAAPWVCWHLPQAPRLCWTVLMPLIPLSIVLVGFPLWRKICPLATLASLGSRVSQTKRRRGPDWLDRWSLLFAFGGLALWLAVRHLVINGDAALLGWSLVALAFAATWVNRWGSGKSWCNLVCPVGVIERIYTGGSQRRGSSRCSPCTGCKTRCPDIDQARAYRAELRQPAVRVVSFALPGLVLGFYAYYALRFGSWRAFFDGRWTLLAFDRDLVLGPGLHGFPAVPALVACPLFLLGCALLSFALWSAIERIGRRFVDDAWLWRHRLLTLASFCAFNLFYLFAGQPTLLEFPVLRRLVAFIVPVVSTVALMRRWNVDPRPSRVRRLPVL